MKLGEILEEYRSTHNLSQRRFATMCNLSNGFMSMLERGINNHTGEPITPTLDTLNKISMGMGIPLDSLLRSLDSNQCISLEPTEFSLTTHEQSVITAYRDQPEKQPQVDTILGVEPKGVDIKSAAKGDGAEASVVSLDNERAEALDRHALGSSIDMD